MADLISTRACIVTCLSTPAALDGLSSSALRTAPDEAILVDAPNASEQVISRATETLAAHDPHAVVVDTTDAWEGLTLAGNGAQDIFAHLSPLELPAEGWIQGDVGRLAAKVIVEQGDRITIFAPSPQAAYLRDRIVGLGATERREPEPWSAS